MSRDDFVRKIYKASFDLPFEHLDAGFVLEHRPEVLPYEIAFCCFSSLSVVDAADIPPISNSASTSTASLSSFVS